MQIVTDSYPISEKASELYDAMVLLKGVQNQSGHKGQTIDQVGRRQQQRQIKEISTKSTVVCGYLYGLSLKSLNMEDSSGRPIDVNLNSADAQSSTRAGETVNDETYTTAPHQPESASQPKQTNAYATLDDDEKENIKTILFIMDRFSISLEGYHELSQAQPSLPKKYLVEGCAKFLDSQWEVKRTPGQAQGAELPVKILLENEIRHHLNTKEGTTVEKIKVKISGDGTRMSHSSNMFVCSFALIEDGQTCLSSSGNHTIAVVKAKEEYESLKESLANVLNDVNSLIKDGEITVDGQRVSLDFYLGGDYKFLLIAMGMKGATSNNSCIWCKLHKNERCNMSHSCEYFLSAALARTVDTTWSKQPGCHSAPFFDIPIENVILDELHLMLRITDRLEQGLIFDILEWDTVS
ncbi:hypothetical protein OS493_027791 [Desmophyllum pertusum]|uniref:Uncharacterized protein n=1 Tax=Desmophyllum pertusum TaxID=174260 RepID=A0A9W9YX09_9CNID|nr:hypothetical protein OS493_027791 [Desmophyllum pertusum]